MDCFRDHGEGSQHWSQGEWISFGVVYWRLPKKHQPEGTELFPMQAGLERCGTSSFLWIAFLQNLLWRVVQVSENIIIRKCMVVLWGGRYGCNNGRYGCTIVMSYIEINKAVSQWLLTFNLCVSVTWPLTCAFHIPCTHTPEIIDMHRGVCDNAIKQLTSFFMISHNRGLNVLRE